MTQIADTSELERTNPEPSGEAPGALTPAGVTFQQQLAELLYLQQVKKVRGKPAPAFSSLAPEDREQWLALAERALLAVDQLGHVVVPRPAPAAPDAERLYQEDVRKTVVTFFNGITLWKKGAIPVEELVLRIVRVPRP